MFDHSISSVSDVIFRVGFVEAPKEVKLQESRPDIGASPMENETRDRNKVQVEQAHSEDIGRNDPCPCGSGKKYKKCCLKS